MFHRLQTLIFVTFIAVFLSTTGLAQENENALESENALDESAQPPEVTHLPAVKRVHRKSPKHYFAASIFAIFHFDSFIDSSGLYRDYSNIYGGIGGSLQFGWLRGDTHWGLEQQFGGIFSIAIDNGSDDIRRFDAATFVTVNQQFTRGRKFKAIFSFGLGFAYTLPRSSTQAPLGDQLSIDSRGTLLYIACKVGITGIWYLFPHFALGITVNEIIGYDIGSWLEFQGADEFVQKEKIRGSQILNEIQPGVTVIYEF